MVGDSILDRTAGALADWFESPILRGSSLRPASPPLFVVGPPRCGTTLIYLHLLNAFSFGYFSNAADAHRYAPVFHTWRVGREGVGRPGYDNEYGETAGESGPSDGWNIFNRWFPVYELDAPVDPALYEELPPIIRGVERIFGGPFANKNNHNAVRLEELLGAFPDARFVHVTRDHRDAVVSLLAARRAHGVEVGDWWSCPPPQWHDAPFDDEIRQSAFNIAGIDAHLERRLAELNGAQAHRISYEAFCEEPAQLEGWVKSNYSGAGITRSDGRSTETPDFEPRSRPSEHDEPIRHALQEAYTRLDEE